MKRLLALSLFAAAPAFAAPHLVANVYPTDSKPDAVSFTVNGGAPIACVLAPATGGVQPKCDLASITTPGTYTLVVTATRAAGITNGANGATVTEAGSASSTPFAYTLRAGTVAIPVLSVAP